MPSSDIPLRQDQNPPIAFRWPLGTDLTGYTVELKVKSPNGVKNYTIGSGLALAVAGSGASALSTVTWTYTLADVLSFPVGIVADYELAYTSPGDQRRVTRGKLNVESDV